LADALADRETNPSVNLPWSGFDLINSFNAWKRSEQDLFPEAEAQGLQPRQLPAPK
jgi:hypothetical protein